MPTKLPLTIQTTYQELIERASIDQFQSDFPERGSFFKLTMKGRDYWYHQSPQVEGKRIKRYVGPDTDESRALIEKHRQRAADLDQRRIMVRSLLSAGINGPGRQIGAELETLARAGLFGTRAVIVGTVAYQCYAGMLGYRLGGCGGRVTGEPLTLRKRPPPWLADDQKKAVALWGTGVLINVPSPVRFALHKVIVSVESAKTADSQAKAKKDRQQAEELITVLVKADPWGLLDGLEELLERGPGRRGRFEKGQAMLRPEIQDILTVEKLKAMVS